MSTRPCICRPTHRADDPICQWRPAAAAIDLTEAIDAAHRAECPNEGCSATSTAERAVRAALPHIKRQVREQAAQELLATVRDYHGAPYRSAMEQAARIVRGEQS